jgi:hypothetical protein
MKKIILALVVLVFAAPAWADVVITCAQVDDTNEVVISFDATTEANLVRAFSLNIQLDDDATILSVGNVNPDYYIHPGTIQIDTSGPEVQIDYGTPVAEYDDLQSDTLLGLDSNGITIEMGSLYYPTGPGSVNAPAKNGVLLSIYLSRPTAPDLQTCLTISGNVARAGSSGVVMEDPDEVVTVDSTGCCVDFLPEECYWGQPDYDEWEAVGKPLCWCYPRQCHGNATGEPPEGGVKAGYWYVGLGDLNVLISAWKVLEPATGTTPSGPGIGSVPGGACADFSHSAEGGVKAGYWRVGLGDLNILITNWKVLEPATGTTPSGPGVPPDCLD